jgi:hypothetical protein
LVPRKGKSEPVRRGPYYLWQYYEQGHPVRQRLTSPEAVAQARAEVEAHRRFQALCKELEELTHTLGELERRLDPNDTGQDVKKKALFHFRWRPELQKGPITLYPWGCQRLP